MEFLKTDLIGLVQYLLPGFLASWIFHSLTAHPKSSPFERVIQALIFTTFTTLLVYCVRWILFKFGVAFWIVGLWNKEVEFFWSVLIALLLGVAFSWSANTNFLHRCLQRLRPNITKRTSFPSEWYSTFNGLGKGTASLFVVLHLKGDKPRRLFGAVGEWPDHPDAGHFVLYDACWLLDDGERKLDTVDSILISAQDVEMAEILKAPSKSA